MSTDARRGRARSFLLGGVIGASAAFAAGRRRRRQKRPERMAAPGLRAFEGAPCYDELTESERPEKR